MFHTLPFWILLVGAVSVYWLAPHRWRTAVLATASIGFVTWLSPLTAGALLAWALLFYFVAPLARPAPNTTRRWPLWLLIFSVLAYLGMFKYALLRFANAADIAAPGDSAANGSGPALFRYLLPLGVSYFTFKFIHYAIEVARGNIRHRSLPDYLAWVYLFPTFTAGPIERFDHFLAKREDCPSATMFAFGLTRIMHGLIKKFVFADMLLGDTFANVSSGLWLNQLRSMSTTHVWWLGIAAYLYVYFDFAGYSDVAIGASQLFGFNIMENFEWPLLATNLGAFWKRWHMTLTGWCQTYVYMPVLGLTRRPNLATYAAFVVIGLWHEVSIPWLFWGLYHGTGVVAYGAYARWRRKRRGGTPPPRITWWRAIPGIIVVTLFVAAGEIVTFGGLKTGRHTLEVLQKLIFITPRSLPLRAI